MLGHTVGCHVLPKVGMYVPILAGVANLPAWFHVLNQGGVKMIGVKALNSMGYISHLFDGIYLSSFFRGMYRRTPILMHV